MVTLASLLQAIEAVEAQRLALGDAVTSVVLDSLRRQLDDDPNEPTLEAERKQVTILFADLAGFTSLSERTDPEYVRGLMNDCFAHLAPVIQTYQGTIERFLGDAMVVLFGAPLAHENDPERALRAALGLMEALLAFNEQQGTALQMHIGVNTGLVVTGGIGSPGRQQYSVMGDAINLASRLDDAAEAGEILVGPDTYRLAGALFDFAAQPPMVMKGKADPVVAYKLLMARPTAGTVRDVAGLHSPLVGRGLELHTLVEAIARLRQGQGGSVAVVGEAGLGKSRLIAEAREHVGDNVLWFEERCISHAEEASYAIVREMVQHLAGIDTTVPGVDGELLLRHALRKALPDRANTLFPYLARLLDLPLDALVADRLALLSADVLGQRILEALTEYVRAYARQQPVVVVWEDVQWLDPSSVGVLEALLVLANDTPLLLITAFRPGEGRVAARNQRLLHEMFRERIMLRALDDEGGAQLLHNLLNGADLPDDTCQLFLTRAEGNPFYLEEMLRVLIDDGVIALQNGAIEIRRPITTLDVPSTLQGLIMARIDHLPPRHKRILQTAATVGRVFERRVLAHLLRAEVDEAELDAMLEDLEGREFMERPDVGSGCEIEYGFKHTLIQQTAYNSLLFARRRLLHHDVGCTIEMLYADDLDDYAATLGFHFEQAGANRKAATYLVRAGDTARAIYANAEAMTLYRAAIGQIGSLLEDDDAAQWADLATQLYEHLGDILALTGQNDAARRAYRDALVKAPPSDPLWSSRLYRKVGKAWEALHGYDEALEAYDLAEHRLREVEEQSTAWWQEQVQLQLERMFVHYWRAELAELDALAERTTPLVEQYGTPQQQANFFVQLANIAVRRDRYVISEQTLQYCRKAVRASEDVDDLATLGWARFVLAGALFFAGDLDGAESYFQAVLLIVERTGDIVHQSRCLTYLTLIRRLRGQIDDAYDMAERALETATTGQMLEYIAMARANLGWVAWREGEKIEMVGHAEAAIGMWRQTPVVYPLQWTALLPLLAHAIDEERLGDALGYARTMIDTTQQLLTEDITNGLELALDVGWDDTVLAYDGLRQAVKSAHWYGYL